MFRWTVLSAVLVFSTATLATAQTPPRPTDPVFVRAQTLVSDGNGAAGRALIDSVIGATPPTAPLYPQALFWRATLAANAADAESDYKHIVVDYPLAPQAADALLRLAQLELARGDRDGALVHLQRIPRDYPRSKSLARSSYWTARVLFEKNDVPNACAANANALAESDVAEVELRNQIQYQGQRCPPTAAVATTSAPTTSAPTTSAPTTSAPTAALDHPASSATASSTPTSANTPGATSAASTKVPPVVTGKPKAIDTMPPRVATASSTPRASAQAQRPKPPAEADHPRPSNVDPTNARRGYSVQVAAYNHKAEADKLVSTLSKRGYVARVDGSAAPFRVRIGHYATATEAEDALRKIKAKRMNGFVVRAPER